MADLKAPKRNDVIGRLADILQSGKDTANQYQILPQVPLIGGTGLGDMFMGKAPELINDISYDGLQAAIRGGNTATGGIGTYGARPAVADAALLGLDVAGIGKGLGGLSRRSASALYDKLIEGGTSLSRREALKKLGALSGGAALTGTGLGVARKFLDNAVTDVAPKVIDNVAVAATKNYKFNSLAEYLAAIRKDVTGHMDDSLGYGWQMESPDHVFEINHAMQQQLRNDEQLYNAHKAAVAEGREPLPWSIEHNPKTKNYESIYADEVLSPQAKQEMKDWKEGAALLDSDYGNSYGSNDWTRWMTNSSDPSETLQFLRDYTKGPQTGGIDLPF